MKGVIQKALGLTAGLLLLVPASALAGTAGVEDGLARFDAYFGETNRVTVSELPGPNAATKTVRFVDALPIDVGGGCFHPNASSSRIVDCVVPISADRVRAGLGNRDDRIETTTTRPLSTMRISAEGDAGNDTLLGTALNDVLDGVGGNDVIRGRLGDDKLEGGSGDDNIGGEQGNDLLNGDDDSAGDVLDCGADDDAAVFDLGDTVSNCETETQN